MENYVTMSEFTRFRKYFTAFSGRAKDEPLLGRKKWENGNSGRIHVEPERWFLMWGFV